MRLLVPALAALCLSAASMAGFAHDYKAGALQIEHPWSRAVPPGAPSAGGYMSIENGGGEADRLIGATSPAAARMEVHQMSLADGVMRMRPVKEGLEIAPRMSVTLKPGGIHLMFVDPDHDFTAGERIPVTLEFEKAGRIDVEFVVEALVQGEPADHDAHHHPGDARATR